MTEVSLHEELARSPLDKKSDKSVFSSYISVLKQDYWLCLHMYCFVDGNYLKKREGDHAAKTLICRHH